VKKFHTVYIFLSSEKFHALDFKTVKIFMLFIKHSEKFCILFMYSKAVKNFIHWILKQVKIFILFMYSKAVVNLNEELKAKNIKILNAQQ